MVGTTIFSFFFIADENYGLLYDDFFPIFRAKKIIFAGVRTALPGRIGQRLVLLFQQ